MNIPKLRKTLPIAPEGIPLLIIFSILGVVFVLIKFWALGILLLIFAAFNIFFFRNPERHAPAGNTIVAPADGKVILIKTVQENEFFKEEVNKVSIFMNVFNVHINRAPFDGKVLAVKHTEGKFFSADLDKAPEENEKNAVFMDCAGGGKLLFVQVAGLIARRIVSYVKPEDTVAKGDRVGLICYGSRVDIYLPKSVEIKVKLNDITTAGETIIGEIKT